MFANCEPNSHVVQKMDGTARNKEICNVHYKIGGFGLYVWFGVGRMKKKLQNAFVWVWSRGFPISIHFCRMVFGYYGALKLVFVEEKEVHRKIAHGSYLRPASNPKKAELSCNRPLGVKRPLVGVSMDPNNMKSSVMVVLAPIWQSLLPWMTIRGSYFGER